jgi:hypothetical protein
MGDILTSAYGIVKFYCDGGDGETYHRCGAQFAMQLLSVRKM